MKMKKFIAPTTAAALAKVKSEFGDSAVVLSTRTTPKGIEILASIEDEIAGLIEEAGWVDEARSIEFEAARMPQSHPSRTLQPQQALQSQNAQAPRAESARVQPDQALTPEYFSGTNRTDSRDGKTFSFTEWIRRKSDAGNVARPALASAVAAGQRVEHTLGSWMTEPQSAAPLQSSGPRSQPMPLQKTAAQRSEAPAITPAAAKPMLAPVAPLGRPMEAMPQAPRPMQTATRAQQPQPIRMAPDHAAPVPPQRVAQALAASPMPAPAPLEIPTTASMTTADQAAIMEELRMLRGLVEHHLFARPAAADALPGVNKLAAELLPQLLAAGFSTVLARTLANACPDDRDLPDARSWLQGHIVDAIQFVAPSDELVERGGAYALTGPTGVGKTTTAAKIAARCVVKYGAQSLGLVTTDTYRIGAPDQLRIYGKILGVPVHTVQDAPGLRQALEALRGKRMVLIDTVGLAQRDERVQELLGLLDECGVNRLLLLAATSQLATLDDVVHAYRGQTTVGAIITKVDEAAQLGSIVDVLMRRKLSLHYLATGQRVPEDLQIPDREALVARALRVPVSTLYVPSSEEAAAVTAAIGRWGVRGGTIAHA